MLDDFRLRVFMMVAQENSFTRAAQHLGVSQPAVSQNIAELEKQVGAALFERRRGEVALTAEGYVFKEYAAKILHWYEATDALFGSAGKMTVNRPVRIATTSFAATHLLPDLLRDLLAVTATAFIIDTYPESAFPESMDADLYLFASARKDTLHFDAWPPPVRTFRRSPATPSGRLTAPSWTRTCTRVPSSYRTASRRWWTLSRPTRTSWASSRPRRPPASSSIPTRSRTSSRTSTSASPTPSPARESRSGFPRASHRLPFCILLHGMAPAP